ncbi:MAG: terpene utilization protein AtuA, partial [Burkholderiaceae bacterium]
FKRTRRMFTEKGMPDFDETALHLAGAQTLWGANASPDARQAREIVMQIDVRHRDKNALEIFSKETTGVALSMTTGRYAVGNAGRPKVTPVIAQFAFLVDRDTVRPVVCVEGVSLGFCQPDPLAVVLDTGAPPTPSIQGKARPTDAEVVEVPLIELAVARSGDKGNSANIGVMARQPAFIEPIRAALTEQRVKQWFAHVCVGDVIRYEAPGFHAFNFLLTESLGGGGTSSLHMDKQAKSYGQQILAMTIPISKQLLRG